MDYNKSVWGGGASNEDRKPYQPCPEGMHHGRLVSVVDLGHHESEWEGQLRVTRHYHLAWEIAGFKNQDGKPYIMSKEYKASDGDKGPFFTRKSSMYKMLCKWLKLKTDKEKFKANSVSTLPGLLNQAAMLNVVHTVKGDKTYSNIEDVMPPIQPVDPATSPMLLWSIVDGDVSGLPAFLQRKVEQSYQKQGKQIPKREKTEAAKTTAPDEDIPF